MWPIVVCNLTSLDRILAFSSLAMSQSLIFRVRLKEAQTMNKEHHASAPLSSLSATNIPVLHSSDISTAQQRQGRVTRDGGADAMVDEYKETSLSSHSFRV